MLFRSERIYVPDEYSGTPEDAYAALQAEIKKTDDALSECSRKLAKCLSDSAEDLVAAKEQLEQLSGNFDVRRLAACTKSKKETFYILCGWMSDNCFCSPFALVSTLVVGDVASPTNSSACMFSMLSCMMLTIIGGV